MRAEAPCYEPQLLVSQITLGDIVRSASVSTVAAMSECF